MKEYLLFLFLLFSIIPQSVSAERTYFDFEDMKGEEDPQITLFKSSSEMIVEIILNVTELNNMELRIEYVHEYDMAFIDILNETGYHNFRVSTAEFVIYFDIGNNFSIPIAKGYYEVVIIGEATILPDGYIPFSPPAIIVFSLFVMTYVKKKNTSNTNCVCC